jgi:branched-chain amino acid transport system permease protein
VSLGAAYAIAAVGLTLVYRVSRVLNLAHGAVMMGVGLFLAKQEITNPIVLLVVGIALGAAGSAFVHIVSIRTFRLRDHVTRLAVLVGVLFAAGGLAQRWAGTDSYITVPLIAGYWQLPGGATFGKHSFVTLLTVVAAVALLAFFLSRTSMGKSLRAIAEDYRGAVLIGISVDRLLLIAALQYFPEWFSTLQFSLLILVLAFRPQGLLGGTK